MFGRWTIVWLLLCSILAWYIWIYSPSQNISIETDDLDIGKITSEHIDISVLHISILESLETSTTSEWSRKVLVFLMNVYKDIDSEKRGAWEQIYDMVYLPSFAENMIELTIKQRKLVAGLLKQFLYLS